MKTLSQALTTAFSSNFQLYWLSHVAHVNTVGRNFYSDHLFLGEIYEDLQAQIDRWAEFQRTIGDTMLSDLGDVTKTGMVGSVLKGSDFLKQIKSGNETMIDCLGVLYDVAEESGECGLSNYVQDRLVVHRRWAWQLDSILC